MNPKPGSPPAFGGSGVFFQLLEPTDTALTGRSLPETWGPDSGSCAPAHSQARPWRLAPGWFGDGPVLVSGPQVFPG